MRLPIAALVLSLASTLPGLAFDADSQALVDRMKVGKPLAMDAAVPLMLGAERWCYSQRDEECGWSEIYLEIKDDKLHYELSNPWNEAVDISYVSEVEIRDNAQICEIGFNWLPSVRAYSRDTGLSIEGRELAALKQDVLAIVDPTLSHDCYSYVYGGSDAEAETITLTQKQYIGGAYQPDMDAEVVLHYDKERADNLGWYW